MSAIGTHTITLGDTLEPLNTVLKNGNGDPYDLALYTVKFEMRTPAGVVELAATTTGVTKHPTQTFTVDTSDSTVKCVGHGVKNGDQIAVSNSGGALPTGLAASTRYFVVDRDANSFRVASRDGGPYIAISAAGSGTHSFYVFGSAQFDPASANVDTAADYHGRWTLDIGGEIKTLPEGNDYYLMKVVDKA